MMYGNFLQDVPEGLRGAFAGGMIGALITIGIAVAIVLLFAVYLYFSYTWMLIAKKLKYKKAWLAWIPIANISMILQLGGYHWAWVFLILLFIPGWIALLVLVIMSIWRVFEKRKYPGWLSLSLALAVVSRVGVALYLIVLGFVAFRDMPKKRR